MAVYKSLVILSTWRGSLPDSGFNSDSITAVNPCLRNISDIPVNSDHPTISESVRTFRKEKDLPASA